MAINPAAAAAAYGKAAQVQAQPGAPTGAGPNFADMVKDMVGSAIETSKAAEGQAVKGATQNAEIVDVVTAITAAELTLQTVVAVRDKVIAAYQEVMKMPI